MKVCKVLTLVICALMCATSAMAVGWSWKSGDSPYVPAVRDRNAVFADNDGATWRFMDAVTPNDPSTWTVFKCVYNNTYYHPGVGDWGIYTADSGPTTIDNLYLEVAADSGRTGALVFVAPKTGYYSISGKVLIGTITGYLTTTINVGKVVSGDYTQLASVEGPRFNLGPQLGDIPALQNILLNAGDQIVFQVPSVQGTWQRWWITDHKMDSLGGLEENALTISYYSPTWGYWSWKSGYDPYIPAVPGKDAVFPDSAGAAWKFMDATESAPSSWTVLSGSSQGYYLSLSNGMAVRSSDNSSPRDDLYLNASSGYRAALVFVAPKTGYYSISGKVFIGFASPTTIYVGKVVSGAYTQLASVLGPSWGVGPELGANSALQNIALNKDDQIVLLLPGGSSEQRWWITDKLKNTVAGVEDNALTITGSESPTTVPDSVIPYSNSITVDGDLSDWSGAIWHTFDTVYDGNPVDIIDGAWAAYWKENKIYMAVKVNDTAHSFTDSYVDWDARDAVELYIHTTGSGNTTSYAIYQEPAQEWTVGIKDSDRANVWSTNGYPAWYGDYTPEPNVFFAKATIDGQWIYYEAEITPYDYFGGRRTPPVASVVSPLYGGMIVGLDCIAIGNNGGYTGMKSSGEKAGSLFEDYSLFAKHMLAGPSVSITSAKQKTDGASITCANVIVTGVFGNMFYVQDVNRVGGIRVQTTTAMPAIDTVVTVYGTIQTIASTGERYIQATKIDSAASGSAGSLGMTNKSLAGSAATGGAGLSNVGLLVRTTGRVSGVNAGTKTWNIDDGSGVLVKAYYYGTSLPAESNYVTMTGVCSLELVGSDIQRVIYVNSWQ